MYCVRNASRRVGFTLIELLVVIAIIAIQIALRVPAVQKTGVRDQESGNRNQESENRSRLPTPAS